MKRRRNIEYYKRFAKRELKKINVVISENSSKKKLDRGPSSWTLKLRFYTDQSAVHGALT